VELMVACLSPCASTRRERRGGVGGVGQGPGVGSRALRPRRYSVLLLSLAPAINYFDIHLHGHPLGVVGVEAGVENLLHPIDHCLHEPSLNLLGLLLGALDDYLIVDGEDGDRSGTPPLLS
jgi:hypothetical protein